MMNGTRLWRSLIALVLLLAATGPLAAQTEMPKNERVEYNKLLQQRNRLVRELHKLDQKASDLLKQGQEPLVVHADQVSAQDQLDLVELRLAILATRHGVAVPPPPVLGGDGAGGGGATAEDERIAKAFSRGRDRALDQLRRDTKQFLASLDFKAFLSK